MTASPPCPAKVQHLGKGFKLVDTNVLVKEKLVSQVFPVTKEFVSYLPSQIRPCRPTWLMNQLYHRLHTSIICRVFQYNSSHPTQRTWSKSRQPKKAGPCVLGSAEQ